MPGRVMDNVARVDTWRIYSKIIGEQDRPV